MRDSYIPRSQTAAMDWMRVFADGISADPERYQLSAEDAVAIESAVDAFMDALRRVLNPSTATRAAVLDKDDARELAEGVCRQYAARIKVNPNVSDGDKVNIGVRPLNRTRSRISCPQESPSLTITNTTLRQQTLTFRDSAGKSRIAPGAIGLQLFAAIGQTQTADVRQARLIGTFTRTPMTVDFDSLDDGRVATYFARWVSRRGETGQWSSAVGMRIAA